MKTTGRELRRKIAYPELKAMLLETADEELAETNRKGIGFGAFVGEWSKIISGGF
jgi:hypothetical protein